MNKNHFTGIAVFIISLTVAGLVVAAITKTITWSEAAPITIILVEIVREAIKQR